jgi:hypothetical protein
MQGIGKQRFIYLDKVWIHIMNRMAEKAHWEKPILMRHRKFDQFNFFLRKFCPLYPPNDPNALDYLDFYHKEFVNRERKTQEAY